MGQNLNIKNQLVEPQKKRGIKFWNFSEGKQKGETRFLTQIYWGDLGGNYENIYQFRKYYEENNNQFSHVLMIVYLAKCAP